MRQAINWNGPTRKSFSALWILLLRRFATRKKQLEVAEQSMKTAQAILDRSKNRFDSGVAVESDLLSAQVRLATRKQELIRAQKEPGIGSGTIEHLDGGLQRERCRTSRDPRREKSCLQRRWKKLEKQAVEMRPDLKRVRSEEAAQQQSVSVAKSAFGPTGERIRRVGGRQSDFRCRRWREIIGWRGLRCQFDLFDGGAKRARLSHERAMQEKAAAVKEMATDATRLEVRHAYYDLDSARQQVEVARATIAESQESLRINQNRYDSGLSTITDLLAAEEAARRSQTEYWEAVYRYHTGYANLELASGTLNPQSPVVTP